MIPLGDTINRGPKNLATLQTLYSLGATPLTGNHELGLLRACRQVQRPSWLNTQTVSRDLLKSKDADAWLDWIASWPIFMIDKGFIAVHAGLHPSLALLETPEDFLTRVRLCNATGELPTQWDGLNHTFPRGFYPWYHWYRGKNTSSMGIGRVLASIYATRLRGWTQAAVYGNPLSAIWFPSMRLVQAGR